MKRYLIAILIFLLMIPALLGFSGYIYKVGDKISIGRYSDDFDGAVTAIGSSNYTLVIDKSITVTQDVTVPATMALEIGRDGYLTYQDANVDLTINGPVMAGPYQWIDPNRAWLALGNGSAKEAYLEWAGGVGDNSTDCSLAFNCIVTAIGTTGIPIRLLDGTYISDAQALLDNMVIVGEGRGSILKLKSSTNASFLTVSSKSNIRLANFKIDGNGANQSTGSAIDFTTTTNSIIENLYIDDGKYGGIDLSGASTGNVIKNCLITDTVTYNGIQFGDPNNALPTDNLVEGCTITGCNQNAVYCYAHRNKFIGNTLKTSGTTNLKIMNGNECQVIGNYSSGATVQGFHCDNSDDTQFIGNIAYNNGENGIFIEETTAASNRITVSGNSCYSNTQRGLYARNSNFLTITGNHFYLNTLEGCYLNGCDYSTVTGNESYLNQLDGFQFDSVDRSTITGNVARDNSTDPNGAADGFILNTVTYSSISGNIATDTRTPKLQVYGIHEAATCSFNMFNGNVLEGNLTGTILIGAASSVDWLNSPWNHRGVETLSSGTVTVVFDPNEPDNTYYPFVSGNENETFKITGKTISGFTITSSDPNSVATVYWLMVR